MFCKTRSLWTTVKVSRIYTVYSLLPSRCTFLTRRTVDTRYTDNDEDDVDDDDEGLLVSYVDCEWKSESVISIMIFPIVQGIKRRIMNDYC